MNIFVVFFYKFASSLKHFYLIRYLYFLECQQLSKNFSTSYFSSLLIMTRFGEETRISSRDEIVKGSSELDHWEY